MPASTPVAVQRLAELFRAQVGRRLELPADQGLLYARLAQQALDRAGIAPERAQFLAVVDRSPWVQAILLGVAWRLNNQGAQTRRHLALG